LLWCILSFYTQITIAHNQRKQVILTTVLFIQPHPQNYLNPWARKFFGEGGVEVSGNPKLPVVKSGVIMGILGNATAK
jgi:hypothetical protein